jgi:phosphocarrier protein HPr
MMRERKIKLSFDDAREFVKTASRCDFDINVFYNRVIIDAKSILGVLGLDFNQTLTVQYAGEDGEFESLIHRYAVCN